MSPTSYRLLYPAMYLKGFDLAVTLTFYLNERPCVKGTANIEEPL